MENKRKNENEFHKKLARAKCTAMTYKRFLVQLLMLLSLTFGDAKGGGGGGAGGGGGGGGIEISTSSGGGGGGGGGSEEGTVGVLILFVVLFAIFVVAFVICFCWINRKLKSAKQAAKEIEKEYNSEIAKCCKEGQDVKLPSSGTWNGTYTENDTTKLSTYGFSFAKGGRLSGQTNDQDGSAIIRGRYYVLEGRTNVVWIEDYGAGGLKTLCRGVVTALGLSIEGTYKTSTGVTGTFECSASAGP